MTDGNSDWKAKLERARGAAGKLDEVTDSFNRLIDEAEKAIANLRLGVPGRVGLSPPPNSIPGLRYRDLVFTKQDKIWRLLVESGSFLGIDPNAEDLTPLRNANRDIRLEAVSRLPALLDDMITTAVKEVAQVEDAKKRTLQFIESVTSAAAKKGA
jgi:hypothetical protein